MGSNSSEWFRLWFNDDYPRVYSLRDDAEAEAFVANWPIWDSLRPGDWCLDLACGAGRFARAVAKRGMKVAALDLSPNLLKAAGETSRNSIHYLRADIRDIPLKSSLALAMSLFTSFGYFEDDAMHLDVLKQVNQLLTPGGFFILDLGNREAILSTLEADRVRSSCRDDCEILERWSITPDSKRVVKVICLTDQAGERYYRESVRLFSAQEILEMTSEAGFKQDGRFWGDYQGGEMKLGSSRMIYFGRSVG